MALIFALVALLLAAVGVYGTLSHAVVRRRREFGVRLALGAEPRTLLRMVLLNAARLTALALAVGVPAALVAARGIEAFLFGVRPNDPVTLVGSGALVAFVGLVASYLPARRAAGVNPLEVLRSE